MEKVLDSCNCQEDSRERRFCGFRRWRYLRWRGRVWRVIWLSGLSLFFFTLLQVVLGIWFLPTYTPLMLQRSVEQVCRGDRALRYECRRVSLEDISPNMINAVVAAEDGLFPYHRGFDVKQMKIAYRGNKSGRRFRGGSTISQQTAKNVFLPHTRAMWRKGIEAWYTVLIERLWGKERIMEAYLNVIEFGDGIYGVEAASHHYFGHSAAKLSVTEAAQLAVTLPSPLKRNPAHQTPFYRRQVQAVKGRMARGRVNLHPTEKQIRRHADSQEGIIDFLIWYLKKK